MKLIGLTGKARSGKDTIAAYLWHSAGFTRIAFADPLKLAAQNIFGLTDGQTWDDELKEVVIDRIGMSPRQIFQKLGTEAVRNVFGEDTWTKRWMVGYSLFEESDDIVVPDVRFDNESGLIRSLGGVIVEVRRGPGLVGSTGTHPSEHGLSTLPDFVIENNGTLDDLYAQVEGVLRRIG